MEFALETIANPMEVEARWRTLQRRSPTPFFLGWNWMAAWLAATRVRPMLLSGRSGGQEQALAFISRSSSADSSGRSGSVVALNEVGDGIHDVGFIEYNGLVGVPRDDALASELARFFLAARADGLLAHWEEIRFSGVPFAWAEQFSKAGFWVSVRAEQATYAVDLGSLRERGRGALDDMTSSTRRQIRRARRLYEATGELRLIRAQGPTAQRAALDDLASLHQARWRARGKPGAFASPIFVALVDELLARSGPADGVEILRACVGQRTIGLLLNLTAGGDVLNYQSAFVDEADNRLKPGLLTHALAIDHYLKSGRGVYDLLAGDARYKASLAAPRERLVWLSIRPRTLGAVLSMGRRWAGQRIRRALAPNTGV